MTDHRQVAALYVETGGCYFDLEGVDPWDEKRDARLYDGPHPVVAHPPCNRWSMLANVCYARYGGEHLRPGNDGGCFEEALRAVRRFGGVLEHPAQTMAFRAFLLPRPVRGAWQRTICGGWVTEVAQCRYGHRARKLTWLYLYGAPPPSLDWSDKGYTHQVGGPGHGEGGLPYMQSPEARATPPAFRDLLISMARSVEVKHD